MDESHSDLAWLKGQRAGVEAYLKAEGVVHGGVSAEPGWYVPDVLAVWPVQSAADPTTVGWWAISGDMPTDYVSATSGMDARAAIAAFASSWQDAAAHMAAGVAPSGFTIGNRENWASLAPMLRSRADTLARWVADDEMWEEDA